MTPAALVLVEEYLRTSFPDADCEYVDGEVVERNVGELDHSDMQGRIYHYLMNRYPQFWSAIEARLRISPTRYRVPDIMLFAGPKPDGRVATTPPHLVIEVLSPDDRAGYMQEKIDEYLAFGVPYVWIVNPRTKQGYVHTVEGSRPARDGVLRAKNPDIEVPIEQVFG